MKAKDLRQLSANEVAEKLEQAREAYFKLRFQLSTGQLPNTTQLRIARNEIARITTVMKEMGRSKE